MENKKCLRPPTSIGLDGAAKPPWPLGDWDHRRHHPDAASPSLPVYLDTRTIPDGEMSRLSQKGQGLRTWWHGIGKSEMVIHDYSYRLIHSNVQNMWFL
jgi:hypothetical protein